jgi:cyclophilin family peptidyl-prolyl cis-trans isomerase
MEGVFRQVLAHETHPLVRVNLLRALARGEASEESVSAALAATADIYPQVAQTAAESAAGLFARAPSPEMAQRLEAAMANLALPWAVRAPLAGALVGYRADYSALVLEALRNAAGPYEQSAWLQALAQAPANYRYIKERLQTNDVPAVRSAALEALVAIRNHPGFEALRGQKDGLDAEFDDMMVNALQSADIGLIYHASQELLSHPERYPAASDTAMLARVLRGLRLPEDIEAHQALGAVLAKLRGKVYEAPPASKEHPIDWEVVARTPQWQQVLVQTSKGRIVWELLVDEAPGTVATVKALVESGAYNGRAFHRVVPNFVAQGGCPRGDGFGGLPYTIRSEFAPLYYGEGYVGMASAGKDTESCQWFITHSPTPHLDGRYSIFARVVEGMQVVNQLSVGDRIEYMVVVGSE